MSQKHPNSVVTANPMGDHQMIAYALIPLTNFPFSI
jgi:hypothetical protein